MKLQPGKSYKTPKGKVVKVAPTADGKGLRFLGSDDCYYNVYGHRIIPEGDENDALVVEVNFEQSFNGGSLTITLPNGHGDMTISDIKKEITSTIKCGLNLHSELHPYISGLIGKIEELQNDVVWLINNFTHPHCLETTERLQKISSKIPDEYRTAENANVIDGSQSLYVKTGFKKVKPSNST